MEPSFKGSKSRLITKIDLSSNTKLGKLQKLHKIKSYNDKEKFSVLLFPTRTKLANTLTEKEKKMSITKKSIHIKYANELFSFSDKDKNKSILKKINYNLNLNNKKYQLETVKKDDIKTETDTFIFTSVIGLGFIAWGLFPFISAWKTKKKQGIEELLSMPLNKYGEDEAEKLAEKYDIK